MIGYRRSSNKLIVSTSWLSMCYSSKSSAGTWLLHFNSSLAKLTIYYSMCWLRSEKMNWLLIRIALRGHRGETTHSLAISVNGGLFWLGQTGQAQVTESHWWNVWIWYKKRPETWPSSCSSPSKDKRVLTRSSCDDFRQRCGQNRREAWEVLWLHEPS